MSATFRRIRADEVMPGMRVARAKTHQFKLVTATETLAVTTRIVFGDTVYGNVIRPRHGVKLWVREESESPVVREVEPNGTRYYDDDGQPISVIATCGHCGQSWDDALGTSLTPVPSGRCPFEYEHVYDD